MSARSNFEATIRVWESHQESEFRPDLNDQQLASMLANFRANRLMLPRDGVEIVGPTVKGLETGRAWRGYRNRLVELMQDPVQRATLVRFCERADRFVHEEVPAEEYVSRRQDLQRELDQIAGEPKRSLARFLP
jgi:hypothetical protein